MSHLPRALGTFHDGDLSQEVQERQVWGIDEGSKGQCRRCEACRRRGLGLLGICSWDPRGPGVDEMLLGGPRWVQGRGL